MQTQVKEQLEKGGIAVAGALERFMGNDILLERFLKKFLSDSNFQKLTEAAAAGDKEAALIAAHTLKGVCGNLEMTGLFELLSRQVAAFRADEWETGVSLMPKITAEYEKTAAAIRSAL